MPAQPMPGYFFSPQHIILVGASERMYSLGERILSTLLGSAFQGKITPVNLRHKSVAGLQAYATLTRINEPADLVLVVTPPESYDALLRACKKQKFHHVILIQDWESRPAEDWQTAAAVIKKYHGSDLTISVCNSAAIQLPTQGLNTGILPDFPAGHTALLTGSSAVSSEISLMLHQMQQGVSRHISLNHTLSPTTSADWLNRFGHNRHTRVAVVHYNPQENPRKLFSAIRYFTRHTPLILHCTHAVDDTEKAVLYALARHGNFLITLNSSELEAALHARLSDLKPASQVSLLSDTPAAWLEAPARTFGIRLDMPSEHPALQQGCLGSHPTPTLFRSLAAKSLQQPTTDALLAVIAPKNPEDEQTLTHILKRLAQQSDKPLLISSRFSDGLLHFSRPEQALQALSLRNTAVQLQHLQLQTAPPKSSRLKTLSLAEIDTALAKKDWNKLAAALNLPEYRHNPPHPAAYILFSRHPHYGAVVTADCQGRHTAVLPPFTTLDSNHLADFLACGRLKTIVTRLLHTLNFLITQDRYFGEIRLNLGSDGFSSDFYPSPPTKPLPLPTAADRLHTAAEFIRNRNAAAADFLLHTGEAAGLLNKNEEKPAAYAQNVLAPYPAGYPLNLTLRNGSRVSIRPFEPEDADAKQAFVRSLSPEARYTRFMAQTNELPPATLARFSKLDYSSEGAFIAENSDGLMIGVSRFSRRSRDECEFGITLAESARGSGLALEMMKLIIQLATEQGYQSMSAEILKENTAMLKLAEKSGFTLIESDQDHDLYQAKLRLSATPDTPKRKFRQ